jgi:ketosteroid isomerase-like protein
MFGKCGLHHAAWACCSPLGLGYINEVRLNKEHQHECSGCCATSNPRLAEGEQGGDYRDFKALLSPTFRFFAHPFVAVGTWYDDAAQQQMLRLIAERELHSNYLTFSNITLAPSQDVRGEATVIVEFDSVGTLANGMTFTGRNAIVFGIEDGTITSFREYLRVIDPHGFK